VTEEDFCHDRKNPTGHVSLWFLTFAEVLSQRVLVGSLCLQTMMLAFPDRYVGSPICLAWGYRHDGFFSSRSEPCLRNECFVVRKGRAQGKIAVGGLGQKLPASDGMRRAQIAP